MSRNLEMAERISRRPCAIRSRSCSPATAAPGRTRPRTRSSPSSCARPAEAEPVFFANLGDFAGPGHARAARALPAARRAAAGAERLRDRQPRPRRSERAGRVGRDPRAERTSLRPRPHPLRRARRRARRGRRARGGDEEGVAGPREEALAFLDRTLEAAAEPHRVVLMHAPPASAAGSRRTPSGASTCARPSSSSSCAATASRSSAAPTPCSSTTTSTTAPTSSSRAAAAPGCARTCTASAPRATARPEDRGALFHAVKITIAEDGDVSGEVLQAFGGTGSASARSLRPWTSPRRRHAC